MKNPLQKLPFPVEFAVVVAGAFGYDIVSSVLDLVHPHAGTGPTELGVWRAVAIEAATTIALGLFLWGRGWSFKRLGLDTDWKDGPWALALAAASFFAILAVAAVIETFAPGLMPRDTKPDAPALTFFAVAALVLVNAFYEEVFAAGYIIAALKEKSLAELAINLAVIIRIGLYLSDGVVGVAVMVPIGLIFGIWFARTGRLWPLILAHTLLNAWTYAHYIKW